MSKETLRTGVPLLAEREAASDAAPGGLLPCARSSSSPSLLAYAFLPPPEWSRLGEGMQVGANKVPPPDIFRDSTA